MFKYNPKSLLLDLENCQILNGQVSTGLGSISTSVIESKHDYCVVSYTKELEGGYSTKICTIPKSLDGFKFTSNEINTYCRINEEGNSLLNYNVIYLNLPFGIDIKLDNSLVVYAALAFLIIFIGLTIRRTLNKNR